MCPDSPLNIFFEGERRIHCNALIEIPLLVTTIVVGEFCHQHHGGSVGAQTISFSDAVAKLLCDPKLIKQSHALKITHSLSFFLDATEQSDPFLSTRC